MPGRPYIRAFEDLSLADVAEVGGKTASIGELWRALSPLGVRIPPGFAVTAQAWRDAMDAAGAWPRLHALLDGLDKTDSAALALAGQAARSLVLACPMPAAVEAALRSAWRALQDRCGPGLRVAVRSSATAEDLPSASFAGQHESFLNVDGEDAVVDAVRRCQASLFTDRAISYRIDQGFDHFKVALSVAVMKMVRSDLAASGVAFTLDTESGHPDVVFINAAWGLGENVVQGTVDPDEFYVHKPTWRTGARCVLSRRVGRKQWRMVLASGPGQRGIVNEAVDPADQDRLCIDDAAVLEIAGAAIRIEEHYSRVAGVWRPMDVEWAQDGPGGPLYVVQARPETVASQRRGQVLETYVLEGSGVTRAQGRAVGERIAAGRVRHIANAAALPSFKPGEVLVADTTNPDWEPVMKTAAAIVTESGGRTCHAAIVARELGIPAVVGAQGAGAALSDGEAVTVSCAEGDVGHIYAGTLPFRIDRAEVSQLPRTATRVMVNLGNPGLAFKTALLPCDGVGLARMEFIINEHIRAHPMALLHPERIAGAAERQAVERLWSGWPDGARFFVDKLAEGIGTIAAAFWPRPVVVRLSDFKTSEYAALAGGSAFEPLEVNPMIGFRGAARYVHPAYAEAFALECEAVARVRGPMGLGNVKLMVPFCRRLDEARQVIEAMAAHGLRRGADGGPDGLEVIVMCEIPNNVILIDEFAALFDGFSIGSNDLTQLTLGVDRDSAIVAESFDEQDPGMLRMYRLAIEGAHRHGRPIGICGQAPSDHPALARYLVGLGIDSLSLSPDRLLATVRDIAAIEQAAGVVAGPAVAPAVKPAAKQAAAQPSA